MDPTSELWLGVLHEEGRGMAMWASLEPGPPLLIGRSSLAFPGRSWPDRALPRRQAEVVATAEGQVRLHHPSEAGDSAPKPYRLVDGGEISGPLPAGGLALELDEPVRIGGTSTRLLITREREKHDHWDDFEMMSGVRDHYADWEELPYGAKTQLRLLQEELPAAVQSWMQQEREEDRDIRLFERLSGLIAGFSLGGSPVGARAVAFVEWDEGEFSGTLLHGGAAPWAGFTPSHTLLRHAAQGEPGRMCFGTRVGSPVLRRGVTLSADRSVDWAMAMTLPASGKDEGGKSKPLRRGGRPLMLYMEERESSGTEPEALLPFARTIGLMLSSLLEVREHQRRESQLARYFSPRLRNLVRERPLEAFAPTLQTCTVLFCDRRGSSRQAEAVETPCAILRELERNRAMLGAMSAAVFENDGVVADFAGDQVLGFWGWPKRDHDLSHVDAAIASARQLAAALIPYGDWDAHAEKLVAGFRIGISTGEMAVGNVGPAEQLKIGVFGQPVNLGARLESFAKLIQIPIVVSEETRKLVRDSSMSFRRLATIRPNGFDRGYTVYELVLPRDQGGSGLSAPEIDQYHHGLECFERHHWDDCRKAIEALARRGDGPANWLLTQVEASRRRDRHEEWDG